MWGWFTKLFGSNKETGEILTKAADGLYNGIDKLIYTEEEKGEALAKSRELFLDFAKTAYDQNSIRAISRRWLAFLVVGPCMGFYVVSGVAYFFDIATAFHFLNMANNLVPWAGGILAFYFGPHIIGAKK